MEESQTKYHVKNVYIDRIRVKHSTVASPMSDYLKYYRVVRYWVREKYGWTGITFEVMQFLYSERIFNKSKYLEYMNIFAWDKSRWKKLNDAGLVTKFRVGTKEERALYTLTPKAKRIMRECYDKLNGKEVYSELPHKNPFFNKAKAGYAMKTVALQMKTVNKEVKKKIRDNARSSE